MSRPSPAVTIQSKALTSGRVSLVPLHLPGALLFARPKGALRLSARLIPNRFSDPESMILSRNDHLIPTRLSYPEAMIFSRITSVTDEEKEE